MGPWSFCLGHAISSFMILGCTLALLSVSITGIVGAYDISSVLEEYSGSMEPRILKLGIVLLPECIIGGVDL